MPKSCPKCGGPMPSRHTGNCAGCVLDNVNEARRIAGVILGDAPPPKPPKAFTETITSLCTDSYTQGREDGRWQGFVAALVAVFCWYAFQSAFHFLTK